MNNMNIAIFDVAQQSYIDQDGYLIPIAHVLNYKIVCSIRDIIELRLWPNNEKPNFLLVTKNSDEYYTELDDVIGVIKKIGPCILFHRSHHNDEIFARIIFERK